MLQGDHSLQELHAPFTGHLTVLHASESVSGPVHARPPCDGPGLSHVRNRRLWPPPQVAVHDPHDDHDDQPPFTGHMSRLQ